MEESSSSWYTLFARKEKDLEKEMKTKRFDIPIIFLQDQYAVEKE